MKTYTEKEIQIELSHFIHCVYCTYLQYYINYEIIIILQ